MAKKISQLNVTNEVTDDDLLEISIVNDISLEQYTSKKVKKSTLVPVTSVSGKIGDVELELDDIAGVGSIAYHNTEDFATAVQGSLAETALQDAPTDGKDYVRRDASWVELDTTPQRSYIN